MGIDVTYRYQDSGNQRSKRKRMRLLGKIWNVCPHIHSVNLTSDDAGSPAVAVQYAFETFYGTLDYFCMICHSRWSQHRIDLFQHELMTVTQRDLSGTTRDILERTKKADKLIRKLNRLGGAP
ncbi:MAG: hypothetical protein OXM88_06440 [bacterium]|nr:hypothetical protein [bacterium]